MLSQSEVDGRLLLVSFSVTFFALTRTQKRHWGNPGFVYALGHEASGFYRSPLPFDATSCRFRGGTKPVFLYVATIFPFTHVLSFNRDYHRLFWLRAFVIKDINSATTKASFLPLFTVDADLGGVAA